MDELTKDDDELILDECLTFFFAGTQTSSIANSNLIFMLVKHPEVGQKILDEVQSEVIEPYLKQHGLSKD
jgi:cytochrome P450